MSSNGVILASSKTCALMQEGSTAAVGYVFGDREVAPNGTTYETQHWITYPSFAPPPATACLLQAATLTNPIATLQGWTNALNGGGLFQSGSNYYRAYCAPNASIPSTDPAALTRAPFPSSPLGSGTGGQPLEVNEGTTPLWSASVDAQTGTIYRDASIANPASGTQQWYEYFLLLPTYTTPDAASQSMREITGARTWSPGHVADFLQYYKTNWVSGSYLVVASVTAVFGLNSAPANP